MRGMLRLRRLVASDRGTIFTCEKPQRNAKAAYLCATNWPGPNAVRPYKKARFLLMRGMLRLRRLVASDRGTIFTCEKPQRNAKAAYLCATNWPGPNAVRPYKKCSAEVGAVHPPLRLVPGNNIDR